MFRLLIALLAVTLPAAEVERTETIDRTFQIADPAAVKLLVDTVNGSISVTAYDGDAVEMKVKRHLRAESEEAAARAKKEERLEITQNESRIVLYVDGPYRRQDGKINYRGWRYYGYESKFDFEIRVPRAIQLDLSTVNGGDVTVQGTRGDFRLKNVNGSVLMDNAGGSGQARTVNGRVRAEFQRNPRAKSSFGSINGDLVVVYPRDLAADVRVKTFNGEVFTDYSVAALPSRAPTKKIQGNKRVFKTDGFSGMRIGQGGPEIEFDAFNGDVRILSAKE